MRNLFRISSLTILEDSDVEEDSTSTKSASTTQEDLISTPSLPNPSKEQDSFRIESQTKDATYLKKNLISAPTQIRRAQKLAHRMDSKIDSAELTLLKTTDEDDEESNHDDVELSTGDDDDDDNEDSVELEYDEKRACYFDPNTGKYYEILT